MSIKRSAKYCFFDSPKNLRVFVLHVPLQVEFFKLCKSEKKHFFGFVYYTCFINLFNDIVKNIYWIVTYKWILNHAEINQ